ncbi:MAG: DUF58 domain-containing protein [Wenzhouxiangellaceae bacterium]|nr:DUF58 domain-containing protein [Wenzhouxiangellaceae bacterium]
MPREPFERWLQRWLRRRGPLEPPLTLRYRQIYILPTAFGALVGLLLFAMLMGSLNFNNSLGLLTTFLVAGIAVLSMHIAHRNLDRVEILGTDAPPVFAGQPLCIAVTLRDRAGRRHGALVVEGADCASGPAAELEAYGHGAVEVRLPTQTRGRIRAPRLKLRSRHPLGWFEAWSWFCPTESYRVWPKPADAAPPLPFDGKRDASPQAGDESDEFHGLREWHENDPLHRIAWKASQRHNQLLARQFTRPAEREIVLRLERAPGSGLEQRIAVLARWVLEADRAGIEFGMDLGSARISPGRGSRQRIRCLDALADY